MTKKQLKILHSALELFAEQGYDGSSTSKIAKHAGVSEGLIFRHFKNKEGLLDAILEQGQELAATYFASIFEQEDPKKVLETIISIPFLIDQSEYKFWRLIYALKWQQRRYNSAAFDQMLEKASVAFEALGYADPKAEAEVLEMLMDGAATVLLLKNNVHDKQKILTTIKAKYKLN